MDNPEQLSPEQPSPEQPGSEQPEGNQPNERRPRFTQVLLSTLAAAIGVQSDKNRQRDFASGSIKTYVMAGVLFTAVFVLTLLVVVRIVLEKLGQG
ncbi:hypothetical protein Maes01_01105 [Microbulbifer aestuariivivens]|uniref:DUF2970 domain-containing protein n=1 Tax=Microbulbifer aestuariivivens TaxID=1908308 RepID=A0ABP9WPL5_9GAMM